jgi:hypothetical protein
MDAITRKRRTSRPRRASTGRQVPGARYRLVSIRPFDARRGYRRSTPPGVCTELEERVATAQFWRNREGRLVARFSSSGYVYHFAVLLASGDEVPEGDEQLPFTMGDVLLEWLVDGVDDAPEPFLL